MLGMPMNIFCTICLRLHAMLSLSLMMAIAHATQTFTVNITTDSVDDYPGDGVCIDANGKCSLRAAIQESNALAGPDTINLATNVYQLSIDGNIFALTEDGIDAELDAIGDLDISDDLTINGAGASATIIDAGGIDRIFHIISGASAKITGVMLRNGRTFYSGGGVWATKGTNLNISDCIIANNETIYIAGGGGLSSQGNLTIRNCIIKNNSAYSSGGLEIINGTVVIEKSVIHGNLAKTDSGGGILIGNKANVTIIDSVVYDNQAASNGGGIFIDNTEIILSLINSTVSNNTAANLGGGIFTGDSSTTHMNNCSIVYNSAQLSGGVLVGGSVNIRNSIIANNIDSEGAPDCLAINNINSGGYNLIGDNNYCQINNSVGDQIGTMLNPIDPLLAPLTDNGGATLSHALLPGSLAINTGNPAVPGSGGNACESLDQRGVLRITGGVCDIGSYETEDGADLSIILNNIGDTTLTDNIVTQSARVNNTGPNNAVNLSLVLTFPEGSEGQVNPSEDWDCVQNNNKVSCISGALSRSKESELMVQYWRPDGMSQLRTQAEISALTPDPITDNNRSEIVIDIDNKDEEATSDATSFDNSFSENGESRQDISSSASDQIHTKNNIIDTMSDTTTDMFLLITTYDVNNLYGTDAVRRVDKKGNAITIKSRIDAMKQNQDAMAALYDRQTRGNINFEQAGLSDILVLTTTGAAILTGVLNLFLHSTSLLGFFFTFPLWSRIDPVPTVMVNSASRKQRKDKAKRDKEAEDKDGRLGRLLD